MIFPLMQWFVLNWPFTSLLSKHLFIDLWVAFKFSHKKNRYNWSLQEVYLLMILISPLFALVLNKWCITWIFCCWQGYKAITGLDPPFIGMCWWINGLLLPELTVYRGQTYYFKVVFSSEMPQIQNEYIFGCFIFSAV